MGFPIIGTSPAADEEVDSTEEHEGNEEAEGGVSLLSAISSNLMLFLLGFCVPARIKYSNCLDIPMASASSISVQFNPA